MKSGGKKRVRLIVAKSAGFCFGVKRAIRMAFETTSSTDDQEIFTLGQIIHNPQVVEQLRNRGVAMVCDVDEITCGTLIIRTHGITKREMESISEKDVKIVDATCPFVKKAKDHAISLAEEGYTILIVGDSDHPEVRSILSYVEDTTEVITDYEQIEGAKNRKRAGLIAQTTQTVENLERWVLKALSVFSEVRVFNTICSATTVRQKETVEISKRVDGLIVIGGRNSANTRRLVELAKRHNENVFHVERESEVDEIELEKFESIGISAGASTPDWLIESVIERIKKRVGGGECEITKGIP